MLEKDIERILAAYGLQHIPDINLTLMTGNLEEAPRAANLELRGALAGFITQTGRFTVKNLIFVNIYITCSRVFFYKVNSHSESRRY